MIPISFLCSSTTGMPEIRYLFMSARTSLTRRSARTVTGSRIIPLSDRLTRSTSSTCCGIVMFLWRTPIPPSRAMAIAIADSVTVSIAALMRGTFSVIRFVRRDLTSTSRGRTEDRAGTSSTSS